MQIKRVGILRGGIGNQYANSVRKGGEIISHIFENLSDKYKVVDIFIDKNSNWHANGLPIIPADLVRKVDVVWNTSGDPGFSVTLDSFSIPNIGNKYFSKVLENNNDILRKHVKEIGVQMPRSIVLPKNAREVFQKFAAPWIVKINNEIRVVKTFNELTETIKDRNNIIVEEFIAGKSSTVHSISGFRGEDIYVLPSQNFSTSEKEKIINFTQNLHRHLNIEHYLKSDFVLHPKKGFFLTNIESSPDLRKGSHFEQSCQYVGAEIHHIIGHILEKVLNKKI
jgi:D-alanine-D-alanine ligase-like ATP-grasp enzyme